MDRLSSTNAPGPVLRLLRLPCVLAFSPGQQTCAPPTCAIAAARPLCHAGDIPPCEHCGAPRKFEFQVMPQVRGTGKVVPCYVVQNLPHLNRMHLMAHRAHAPASVRQLFTVLSRLRLVGDLVMLPHPPLAPGHACPTASLSHTAPLASSHLCVRHRPSAAAHCAPGRARRRPVRPGLGHHSRLLLLSLLLQRSDAWCQPA